MSNDIEPQGIDELTARANGDEQLASNPSGQALIHEIHRLLAQSTPKHVNDRLESDSR